MAVNWPSTLPKNILRDGFSFSPQSGIVRSETESGFPLVRRRFTGVSQMLNVSMVFTPEQFLTFRTFFNNSVANPVLPGVAHGSSRLNFPDPMWFPSTGETEEDRPTVECRFMIESNGQPYTAVPDGDSRDWRVSFVLEVLPSA